MAWFIAYKEYQYNLTIDDLEEFYSLLKLRFNVNDESYEILGGSDRPFDFEIKGNSFKVERNLSYARRGWFGPTVYCKYDKSNSSLKVVIKYDLYWKLAFVGFAVFILTYLIFEDVNVFRAVFSTGILSGIIYSIGLIAFHIEEERFPMNFEKRFRKHIISRKVIK